MEEKDYFLGLSVFPGIGPGRLQLLLNTFGSARGAWETSRKELKNVLKEKLTDNFILFRDQFNIGIYKQKLEKANVSFITWNDKTYPEKLQNLKNPPFVLYVRGNNNILNQVDKKLVGIVGTRKMTGYGRQITETFTRELVEEGFVTISGLALGVDAVCHQTTMDSGGKTIAVLGCGVDICYPSSNQPLYRNILETGGLIISEYPLGMSPNKGSFPSRNRIIAALSDGLLVTEGAQDSGSLITAGIALDLKRKVFAVPGPITSELSRGPLELIRKGARLVTSAEEILQELGGGQQAERKEKKKIRGETKEEQKVIDCLMNENMSFDEIVKKTGISAHILGSLLSLMELKGSVHQFIGGYMLKD